MLKIVVAAGRAVGAEGALVAGYRRGHAQGGIAAVVFAADHSPGQLAQGVELLGEDLAGADYGHRIAAVLLLDALELSRCLVQRGIPVHGLPVIPVGIPNQGL